MSVEVKCPRCHYLNTPDCIIQDGDTKKLWCFNCGKDSVV